MSERQEDAHWTQEGALLRSSGKNCHSGGHRETGRSRRGKVLSERKFPATENIEAHIWKTARTPSWTRANMFTAPAISESGRCAPTITTPRPTTTSER